jgi:hypothetical protein
VQPVVRIVQASGCLSKARLTRARDVEGDRPTDDRWRVRVTEAPAHADALDDPAGLGCVKRHVDVDVPGGVSRDRHQSTLSAEVIRPGRHSPQVVLARPQAKVVAPA